MRDRHFMEDENEWPYLVSEDSHYYGYRGDGDIPLKMDFKDVSFTEFASCARRLMLSSKDINIIVDSIEVHPKNCRFSISQRDDSVTVDLDLKNTYLTARFHCKYDIDESRMLFYHPYENHDGIESMQWFKREVRRVEKAIGLKFQYLGGGYDYNWRDDRLTILDELDVRAYFSDGGSLSDVHSYTIELDNQRLVKYHVHSWFEMIEPLI